ncbi:MAG: NUDIX hydrolase [Dehalococcoidales bacterium]|jgi:ADP-ribose pyrophosphatase|nr:NUDIX hydrolase [Dehalococcoidales bacterium]MDD5604706.1 NUDIX hydrolase [Dehalococcoidales bacterium]MDX9985990.1 NUDIX hydrolase [Dehalococcoidales bacterium]NLE90661.1 NUDIX hydrolase [Dehalococcoidales bacterium]
MQEITIGTNYVYKGTILNLRADIVKTATGRTASREVVEHVDSVGIIALDEQDNLLLVNQFRYPAGENLLEIPAGCIESGESPDSTVIRELREETGFEPGYLKKLGGFYLAPGYANEYMHIYIARELRYSPLVAEDTETIDLIKKTLPEVEEMIKSGQIKDCKTIAALFMFLNNSNH